MKQSKSDMQQKVYRLIARIPKGYVVTYGQIAKALKMNSPRQVGKILHNNKDPHRYPCHRVVFADGRLSNNYAFGGLRAQKRKLIGEGVNVIDNKVVLKTHRYAFNNK